MSPVRGIIALALTRLLLALAAVLVLGLAGPNAGAQSPPAASHPPTAEFDKLSPEEQAGMGRYRERWRTMSPEQRGRALENYRHWQSLTPAERQQARQNKERLQRLTDRKSVV